MAGVTHAFPPLRSYCLLGIASLALAGCSPPTPGDIPYAPWADIQIESLADLSITALRTRDYGSTLHLEEAITEAAGNPAYIASYPSDGNRIYTRIDIPRTPAPVEGYPAVIFVHGWVGREAAPGYPFEYEAESVSRRIVQSYVDAGFLVLSPALRGHGTVGGVAAEGIEFLDAWDNGSYLSPIFYAIDVLNLLEGAQTVEDIDWTRWGLQDDVRIDTSRIGISGHSQGGDAVLTALAVSGEGSTIRNALTTGSIFSGCYGPRFEQAEIYGPMATTLEAFMSGDGSWTGTATGRDGTVNPNFVFGYPSDWIGTVDTRSADWTWQAETWPTPTVAASLQNKYAEMYEAINTQVADISGARFEMSADESGKTVVLHDPRIAEAMQQIGGYGFEEFLTEPMHLHHSDRDYYSIPRWNEDLTSRINTAGGQAMDFTYPGNSHSLLVSKYDWFSEGEVIEGLGYMIERDLALFSSGSVAQSSIPDGDLVSIPAIKRYAKTMQNEFFLEYDREPLEDIQRRVVRFTADGLKQYALVLEPEGQSPGNGWPVLIMNHGYHPDPPNNGRVADGSTDRPGDYYRGLPLAFAQQGFLVVVPDYRGHNISDGLEYTRETDAHYWYTRDVISAFRALGSLPGADTSNVFMWGHSMGGSITMRSLLALGSEVRAASIWSSSDPGRIEEAAFMSTLATPLNIHHSPGDPTAPYQGSASAFEEIIKLNLPANLYTYPGEDHLFRDESLQQAITRDTQFFRAFIQNR